MKSKGLFADILGLALFLLREFIFILLLLVYLAAGLLLLFCIAGIPYLAIVFGILSVLGFILSASLFWKILTFVIIILCIFLVVRLCLFLIPKVINALGSAVIKIANWIFKLFDI